MLGFVQMTLAPAFGYSATTSWNRTNAISDVAALIQGLVGDLSRSNERMQFLTGNDAIFENRLRIALNELVIDDDQRAVPVGAVDRALRLVRALTAGLPLPEVAIDPDGAISLDWMPSRTRAFSISVSDSDRLAYAWINGSDRGHGAVRFADSLPQTLLLQLRGLIAHDRIRRASP